MSYLEAELAPVIKVEVEESVLPDVELEEVCESTSDCKSEINRSTTVKIEADEADIVEKDALEPVSSLDVKQEGDNDSPYDGFTDISHEESSSVTEHSIQEKHSVKYECIGYSGEGSRINEDLERSSCRDYRKQFVNSFTKKPESLVFTSVCTGWSTFCGFTGPNCNKMGRTEQKTINYVSAPETSKNKATSERLLSEVIDKDKSLTCETREEQNTGTHTVEKHFKCEHCDKWFRTRATLVCHTRTHTGEKPFKCKHCDKCFRTRANVLRHTRTHTGEKRFKCTQCDKCFITNIELIQHTRTHTGERPFICEHCAKSFRTKASLVCHARTHTGERYFECKHCDKSFTTKANLVYHTKTHTGERPFKCKHCDKCFRTNSEVKRHARIHFEENLFKCEYCGKCFTANSSLVCHIRTHTGERPFKCKNCGECFLSRSHLSYPAKKH